MMRPDARIARLVRELVLFVPRVVVAGSELLVALMVAAVRAKWRFEARLLRRIRPIEDIERNVWLALRRTRRVCGGSRSWSNRDRLRCSSRLLFFRGPACRTRLCRHLFCRAGDSLLRRLDPRSLPGRGFDPSCHCADSFHAMTLQDQRAPLYVTRQTFSPPSSEIRSEPSRSTSKSTGRPHTARLCSSGIQPTTKSS